jgi:hypothetical protein
MRRRFEDVRVVDLEKLLALVESESWNRFNGLHIGKMLDLGRRLIRKIGIPKDCEYLTDSFDTIYIYPQSEFTGEDEDYCVLLGWAMDADEVGWYKDENGEKVLRCWWD